MIVINAIMILNPAGSKTFRVRLNAVFNEYPHSISGVINYRKGDSRLLYESCLIEFLVCRSYRGGPMNIIADGLTIVRGLLVLMIFVMGIIWGKDALPEVVILTVVCWLTDVLDGMLARKSAKPTRLGQFDLVMDMGLALSLAICLALWGIVSVVVVIAIILVVLVSDLVFHFTAPRKFAMGMTYAGLLFAACRIRPAWAWVILGGLAFLAFLAPKRFKVLVVEFFGEVGSFFARKDTDPIEKDSHIK